MYFLNIHILCAGADEAHICSSSHLRLWLFKGIQDLDTRSKIRQMVPGVGSTERTLKMASDEHGMDIFLQ